jgi:hypothetical protein
MLPELSLFRALFGNGRGPGFESGLLPVGLQAEAELGKAQRGSALFYLTGLDDLGKAADFEARPADQGSIDIGLA